LLNELRQKDPFIQSLFGTREAAVLSCGWTVTAYTEEGKKKPSAKALKIASWVRKVLGQIDGFDRSLAHLLDAIYKGYAVCEVDYIRDKGSIVPKCLRPIAGRRFAFDDTHKLRWYDEGLVGGNTYGVDVFSAFPGKFVKHTPRINGDLLPREGLGRTACWYSCFRSWAWRDWMLCAELYGKPIKRVVYKKGSTTGEDEAAAVEIIQDLTANNAAVHSDALDVIIEWAKSTGSSGESPSESILRTAGAELALAVLGQQMTTGSTSGGLGGSGDTRENVRKDILEQDAKCLSETIRDQLIRYLVMWEFGKEAVKLTPWFSFITEEDSDTKSALESLDIAVNKLKMKIPASYAHEELGYPEPLGEEPVLGESETEEGEEKPVATTGPTGPTGPDGEEEEEPEAPEEPES
jgi:phage gp29-like protein